MFSYCMLEEFGECFDVVLEVVNGCVCVVVEDYLDVVGV